MFLQQGFWYWQRLPIGIVGLISENLRARHLQQPSGVAKKPEQFSKAMLFPAMVETYAILRFLISISGCC